MPENPAPWRKSSFSGAMECVEVAGRWRKSSFSGDAGCVEVAGPWNKSTYSGSSGSCVETAPTAAGGVAVRDTKLGDASPVLEFNDREWRAFIEGVKAGEFDLP